MLTKFPSRVIHCVRGQRRTIFNSTYGVQIVLGCSMICAGMKSREQHRAEMGTSCVVNRGRNEYAAPTLDVCIVLG